jgi:hypothetical protein
VEALAMTMVTQETNTHSSDSIRSAILTQARTKVDFFSLARLDFCRFEPKLLKPDGL